MWKFNDVTIHPQMAKLKLNWDFLKNDFISGCTIYYCISVLNSTVFRLTAFL